MGPGGISIWQLLIILVIVLLLFGTKRLKSIGSDLGNAVKGFRSAMSDSDRADEGQGSEGTQRTLETRAVEGDRVAASTDPKTTQERSRESR